MIGSKEFVIGAHVRYNKQKALGVVTVERFDQTTKFSLDRDLENPAREVIWLIYDALKDKGYDPVNQLVGYILSGDPTYITSYKNARALVKRVERDELLEEFVKVYIDNMAKADE